MTKLQEKLYTEFMKQGKNFMFSPMSIEQALGIVMLGARHETLEEMEGVIPYLTKPGEDDYSSKYNARAIKQTLKIANAVWTQCKLNPEWVAQVEDLGAKVADITDSPNPVELINQWTSDNTNGKISEILKEIKEDQKLIITNAIHFKDGWRYKFDPAEKKAFHPIGAEPYMVDMMHLDEEVMFSENDAVKVISLPYDHGMKMKIYLPKKVDGVVRWEDVASMPQFTKCSVDILLPRFKTESTFGLNKSLQAAGIQRAFTDNAEFPHISETPLKIDDVIHKTFIKVDEEGTEAAAVTAVVMALCSMVVMPPPRKEFYAYRPFTYVIEDTRGNPVFMGSEFHPEE